MSFFENMAIISIGEIKVSHKNTAYVALRNFIQSNANLTNLHFFSFFPMRLILQRTNNFLDTKQVNAEMFAFLPFLFAIKKSSSVLLALEVDIHYTLKKQLHPLRFPLTPDSEINNTGQRQVQHYHKK